MADAAACAHVLVEELVGHGVREVVLAPGSRSAPLAYALAQADRQGRIRLHVRVDERTAGFLALGLAKGSGAPVAVVVTSGTAAANLHPAALEAWHARVPLVLVTASRPRTLLHVGANQSADQDRLFGRHVRGAVTVSDADGGPPSWRFELARLLSAATGSRSGTRGPVQLNVEFHDPLTPTPHPEAGEPGRLTVAASRATAEVVPLPAGPNTVIVAGDAPPEVGRDIAERAAAASMPLLAEPSSNARRGTAALASQRLLAAGGLAADIERVVVVGHPTLSRPISRLLGRRDIELIMVTTEPEWFDPGLAVTRVVDAVALPAGDPGWLAAWRLADQRVQSALARLLWEQPDLSGPELARTLWLELGDSDVLFAGSSNPIRDLDLAPITVYPPTVYANRGLAGIDGSTSTAAGIALAAGRPSHALLGDVTAVHDLTGLVVGPDEPGPDLRIVIASDDGCSIFATLEHGAPDLRHAYERIFGTPHGLDFGALAAAVHAGFRRVTNRDELVDALAEPPSGIEIVEAVIDRSRRRELQLAIDGLGD